VSDDGAYLGGAIAPGLEVSANALYNIAAGLRRAELVPPRSPIGKNTIEALQSGLLLGYAAQVDGMVERFRGELGADTRAVATGGLAGTILPHCRSVAFADDFLTLKGLRLIYALNRET
jgi:type III pantothenate kinase